MRRVQQQSTDYRRGRRNSPESRMFGHSSRRTSNTPERVFRRNDRSTSSSAKRTQMHESRKRSFDSRTIKRGDSPQRLSSKGSRSVKEPLSMAEEAVARFNLQASSSLSTSRHDKRSMAIGKHSDRGEPRRLTGHSSGHSQTIQRRSRSLSPPSQKKPRKGRSDSKGDSGKLHDSVERSGSIPRFKVMLAPPSRVLDDHVRGGNITGNTDRPLYRHEGRSLDAMDSNYDGQNKMAVGSGNKSYTKAELKAIKVGIFRPIKEVSTESRQNINSMEVVLVRRPGEGQRPIFDRDEIRHAQAERGDNEFVERRVVAVVQDRDRSPRSSNQSENFGTDRRENFQINAEALHSRHQQHDQNESDNIRQSLNDRWQKLEPRTVDNYNDVEMSKRKPFMEGPQRGPRQDGYMNNPTNFTDYDQQLSRRRSMSPPSFGGELPEANVGQNRYYDTYIPNERRESRMIFDSSPNRNYIDPNNDDHNVMETGRHQPMMSPGDPQDLRHNLSKRRQSIDSHYRNDSLERQQFNNRSGDGDGSLRRSRSFDRMERGGPDTTTAGHGNNDRNRNRRGRQSHGNDGPFDSYNQQNRHHQFQQNQQEHQHRGRQESPIPLRPHRIQEQHQQPPEEQLPNFSSRPDKYRYNEWMVKPDMVPKGSSYFEHDNRDNRGGFARGGRGGGRGFPPRGRGGFPNRGRGRGESGGNGFSGNAGFNIGHGSGDRQYDFRGRGNFQHDHYRQSNFYAQRNERSPNQWQHDMFQNSPEREMDNKPTSTT